MYFTIPNLKDATTVWYAYSHVQWTQAQLNDNKNQPDLRKKHMQSLDVKAWMGGHNAPHAARMTELGKQVASFAMPPKDQDEAFKYLSAPPRVKADDHLDLIGIPAGAILSEAMERVSPGDAMLLAFNDPLGIAEDLGKLTNPKLHPKANNSVIWDKGRWIGFAGAVVGVGWDAYHGADEGRKGNYFVSGLYFTSAGSGLATAILPLASEEFLAFLVGVPSWPFLVVLFAVNVGILLLDDPATLKWIKRCRFSKAPASEHYSSLEAESFEFVQLGLKDTK